MAVQYFWRHPLAEKVREEGREEGRKEGREEGRKEGRIQNRAEMILRILEWRDVPVPESVRQRVMSCTGLDQLETWGRRAVHAATAEDLFTEDKA
ncbi:hypothetical protein ACFOOM_22400 [Streptomyces echinoruber]|uniref:Uncharacterized protein n=1 Tax=Streptomyces echinoruber TaxID=68898 RepID=A0A918V8U3_9ACTN|nr:hypothetical protein [Streptomyces echinoruber]GGZ82236.1 hypothetical protein GCM10010389_20220 [Streptomyces echinoruber]